MSSGSLTLPFCGMASPSNCTKGNISVVFGLFSPWHLNACSKSNQRLGTTNDLAEVSMAPLILPSCCSGFFILVKGQSGMWAKQDRREEELRNKQLQGAAFTFYLNCIFYLRDNQGPGWKNYVRATLLAMPGVTKSCKGAGFTWVRGCCPPCSMMLQKEGWTPRWDTQVWSWLL